MGLVSLPPSFLSLQAEPKPSLEEGAGAVDVCLGDGAELGTWYLGQGRVWSTVQGMGLSPWVIPIQEVGPLLTAKRISVLDRYPVIPHGMSHNTPHLIMHLMTDFLDYNNSL